MREVGQPYNVVRQLKRIKFSQTYRIISGEELQILGLCSEPTCTTFDQGGIFIVPAWCDTGPRFLGHLLRTDSFSSPFYDKQGVLRTYFYRCHIVNFVFTPSKFRIYTIWHRISKELMVHYSFPSILQLQEYTLWSTRQR